jgi:1,4-alpha-glucan branching enzyme
MNRRVLLWSGVLVACGSSSIARVAETDKPGQVGHPGAGAPSAQPAGPSGTSTAASKPKDAPIPVPPSGAWMGATPVDGAVLFRVWAPNATTVRVSGDFDGGIPVWLAKEPTGDLWSTTVASAKAGQKYRYLIGAADGTVLERVDPRGRAVSGSDSVVVDPSAYAWRSGPFVPPAKNDTVMMEIHVPSFNVRSGDAQGTFASVVDRLDDLRDLGVNALELMPVNTFGGATGWGYNPRLFYSPNAPFGSPDDLRHLVDEAHARGIAVLLDVVYNHCDRATQVSLRCFDAVCGNSTSGIYFFEQDPYRTTPWGPRPNYARPPVADFLVDNVWTWMTEYRVDGFRFDSVSNIRAIDGAGSVPGGSEFLRRANDVARATRPGALLIAEDLKGDATITQGTDRGGLGFDTQWDGGFHYFVTGAVSEPSDDKRDLNAVKSALLGQYNGDPFQRVIYTENHDTVGNGGSRLPNRIDGTDGTSWVARKRSMLAAAVALVTPGVPMLFQGQERLAQGTFASNPSPLDWAMTETNQPVRRFYRDLVRLRRNLDGVSSGLGGAEIVVTHTNDQSGNKVLIVRRRSSADDDVMVLLNFTARAYTAYDLGLPEGGEWAVRLDSDDSVYSADFTGGKGPHVVHADAGARDGLPFTGSVALGPYSVVVLSKP